MWKTILVTGSVIGLLGIFGYMLYLAADPCNNVEELYACAKTGDVKCQQEYSSIWLGCAEKSKKKSSRGWHHVHRGEDTRPRAPYYPKN